MGFKVGFTDAFRLGIDFAYEKERFRKAGIEFEVHNCNTEDDILEQMQDCDVHILVAAPYTKRVIDGLPKLKGLCRFGIGVDSIDVPAATEKGVKVCNDTGYCLEEVATHAFALILDLFRKTTLLDRSVRGGEWTWSAGYEARNLTGITVGLAGCGNIARYLLRFLAPFHCRVIAYDPFLDAETIAARGAEKVSFDELLERCGIPRPEGRTVFTLDEALQAAQEVGYPVLMRPSYVLGGQNMIVAYNSSDVIEYMGVITKHVDMSHPVLMDKYILGTECEVDAICDGTDYLVPGIMQQVERTGVHSGDSICVYPPTTFSQKVIDTLVDYTGRFARELKVVGLVNVQYAVQNDRVYVIEVNPRSSRTVPYISKVTGVPMVDLAVRCTLGEKLKDMGYGTGLWRDGKSPYYAVKVPVYSFLKLHGVDTMLGPEMKSTGEVLGIAPTFHEAMMKGLVAAGYQFKTPGPGSCVIISVKDGDKAEAAELAWKLHDYGYKIYGTPGTAKYLNSEMVPCSVVRQMSGARPNVIDLLESGLVDYIISTSPHGRDPHRDSVKFRRKATELSIPTITAMDTARVLVDALRGDHDISQMELVDIANLHREAASGK